MRSDDLVPVLARSAAAGVGFRQGTVLSWDPLTAHNTVDVGGSVFTDLPILNTSEAMTLRPGDVVGIMTTGQSAGSWWIMGRITLPGSPQAASALSMLGIQAATIPNVDSTTSGTYIDLGTVGPVLTDVLVGQSGRCLVFISTALQEFSGDLARGGEMSFAVSGATVVAPNPFRALRIGHTDDGRIMDGYSSNNLSVRSTAIHLLDGLNTGSHTFTAKYKTGNAGTEVGFFDRTIMALPL